MSSDAVSQIRARVDLVDLISAHVRLQKAGASFKGLCPFHEEKTPSFHVNPERGMWHCFGCQEHGDCFTFLMKIESLSFPEALQRLSQATGIPVEGRSRGPAPDEREGMLQALSASARYFRQRLASSAEALAYLKSRHVDPVSTSAFEIGYAPPGWEGLSAFLAGEKVDSASAVKAGLVGRRRDGSCYDRFRNRLMFPVWDHTGQIVGFGGRDLGTEGPKYLNSPETPVFHKGSILYGLNFARKAVQTAGHAVLVEGFLDVISAHRAGVQTAVACMGTAFGDGHVALLKRICDRVIVCLDSDSAGQKAAVAAGETLEGGGLDVRVAQLPGGEDPDSLVVAGREADLIRALEDAIPGAEHRLDRLLSSFNLADDAERSRMLSQAAQLLARVANEFERDRLILKLVTYHADFDKGAGFDRGRDSAEARIREAVGRIMQKGRAPAGKPAGQESGRKAAAGPARPFRQAGGEGAAEKAERILLRELLQGGSTADYIAGVMSADAFVTDPGRRLAEEIYTRRAVGEEASALAFDEEGVDPQLAQMASSLMVRTDHPPVSVALVDDCVARIGREATRRTLESLEAQLRRGDLQRTDPRYQRYLEMKRKMRS